MSDITIHLKAHSEPLAPNNPFPQEFSGEQRPLLHQLQTYEALAAGNHLVVNTYNTGTGKTRAALLHLRDIANRDDWQRNCLLIAPTNELIHQHVKDVKGFVQRNGLPHEVHVVTAPDLDAMDMEEVLKRKNSTNRGLKLRQLLDSPRPYVMVTNPDIFYYALYFCYGRLDKRALFNAFWTRFGYVIIDEFHYYNAKQLANFLFYMSISKWYGHFDAGLQMCLLSATPTTEVKTYLERLNLRTAYVQPDNAVSGDHETTPALSPLVLKVSPPDDNGKGLLRLVEDQRSEVIERIGRGGQGAGISGALWRVNLSYDRLRHALGEQVGRLTGAEGKEARRRAREEGYNLLLATPTVDIGYNFERKHKTRQNIDFLLFDARSGDEFVQRLGRAGRVLGKEQADVPSYTWGIATHDIYEALKGYDGQEIDRATLNSVVRATQDRHQITTYIKRGAICEAFWPIYNLRSMVEDEDKVRQLFDSVRSVYAPHARATYDSTSKYIRRYLALDDMFKGNKTEDDLIQKSLGRYLKEEYEDEYDEYTAAEKRELSRKVRHPQYGRTKILTWLERKREAFSVASARFSFRDSFNSPEALVYDPQRALSSDELSRYDAIHIARNFEAKWFSDWSEWADIVRTHMEEPLQRPGGREDPGLYCIITRMLEPDARIQISLRVNGGELDRKEWEARYAYREASIKGLELAPDKGKLPPPLTDAFKSRYVPIFATRDGAGVRVTGALINICKAEGWPHYNLEVTLAGGATTTYKVVLGTAMLLAYGELWPLCNRQISKPEDDEPAWVI